MYVCLCQQVTDHEIRDAVVDEGARSMRDLQRRLGVAASCGCCTPCAREVLMTALQEVEGAGDEEAPVPSPLLQAG